MSSSCQLKKTSLKKKKKTKTLLRNYRSIFYNTYQYTTVNVRNLMVITASCPSIQTHTRIYIMTTMKCSIEAWPLMLYFLILVFCYIGRFQHNWVPLIMFISSISLIEKDGLFIRITAIAIISLDFRYNEIHNLHVSWACLLQYHYDYKSQCCWC